MPIKKKSVKSSTVTVQAPPPQSLEENSSKEEVKKPVVTQVVEVVEEQPEQVAVQPEKKETLEEPQSENAPSFGIPRTVEEEKKKEVVDELFAKNDTASSEVMPEISIHTKSTKNVVFLWGFGLVVACLVIGGGLFFATKKKSNFLPSVVMMPKPTATTTPKTTPNPTPAPAVKRSAITIQVLNGGGVVGAATKMKKFLEDKGYTVAATANADAYTYDKTEVLVKASDSAFLTMLTSDLKDTYTLGTSAATLDSSVQYDARVIVGKQ